MQYTGGRIWPPQLKRAEEGSQHLKYLPLIIQGTTGTELSVRKPNEIMKANLLTQRLIGNQFSLPTVQGKNQGENGNAAPLHL